MNRTVKAALIVLAVVVLAPFLWMVAIMSIGSGMMRGAMGAVHAWWPLSIVLVGALLTALIVLLVRGLQRA